MKNIFITGATSFIGLHLVRVLLKLNYRITSIVRPDSSNLLKLPQHKNLTIIKADIYDANKILQITPGQKFEIFYHLAWEGTRMPARNDIKIQLRNYERSIDALKLASSLGCHTFLSTGSQAEYGNCSGFIDENYPTIPTTAYGKYKLKTYMDGKKLAQQNNIRFLWARIFSVYGEGDFEGSLVMSSLNKMLKEEKVLLTECSQIWDFLYIGDAVETLIKLGESNCPEGIYNIASGYSQPLKEYVLEMARITKTKSLLLFGAVPYTTGGDVSFSPVIDKLSNLLGWKPTTSFESGIKKILLNWSNGE